MLSHLWKKNLGTSIIDICLEPYSQTVSVGDVSGNSYIFDYYGNVITEYPHNMPVWGVSHATKNNGTITFASGHADKIKGKGLVSLYSDDEILLQHETSEPIWDTCILGNIVFASGWEGGLYAFDCDNAKLIERIEIGTPLYGLCKFDENSILINAEKDGVYKYSIKNGISKIVSLKNNCYNISYSERENFFSTGTHGPYMFSTSSNGVNICKKEGRDILSVVTMDKLVISGSKSGQLTIWSTIDPNINIYTSNQGSEIWNISYDEKHGHIFLALGDGSISCFYIELNQERILAIDKFLSTSNVNKKNTDLILALQEGVPDTVIIPSLLNAITNNEIEEKEAKNLIETIDNRAQNGETDFNRFIKSILCFSIGEYQLAVDGLQIVDSTHPYYSLAVVLFAKSLIGLGNYDDARQYLVANVSSIEKKYIPEIMSMLENLGVETSNSLTKTVSSNSASYRSLLEDRNRNEIFSIANQKKGKASFSQSVDYGVVNYIKYEYPSRSDHAKKILEKSAVENYLFNARFPSEGKPVSLDIGCATCRYPLWLSANGFYAVGYDIDDAAIHICKMRSEGDENVCIEKKNILEHDPEYNRFSLVTCMMGTFNHIPLVDQHRFIHWIYESLKSNGMFIFSSWNKECPYTSHLHFYNREEREYIQRNTKMTKGVEDMLKDSGFIVEKAKPIAFLPDECYEAWLGEINELDVLKIDQHLLDLLSGKNSQMYVFCAVKV